MWMLVMEAQLCKCAFFNRLFEIPLEQTLMASKYQNWCDIGEKMEKRTSCIWTSTLMMEIFQPYPQQNVLIYNILFLYSWGQTSLLLAWSSVYILNPWSKNFWCLLMNQTLKVLSLWKLKTALIRILERVVYMNILWHGGFLKFTTMNYENVRCYLNRKTNLLTLKYTWSP